MRVYACFIAPLICISIGNAQSAAVGLTPAQNDKLDKEVGRLLRDYPKASVKLNDAKMPLLLSNLDEGVRPAVKGSPKTAKDLVQAFFARYATLFRNNTALSAQAVGIEEGSAPRRPATSAFAYGPEIQDPFVPGRTIVTVQQTVNGLPVYGAEAKVAVNVEAAAVAKFDGSHLVAPVAIDTSPSHSEEEALSAARSFYDRDLASDERTGQEEKSLFPGAKNAAAATLLIVDTQKLGLPKHEFKLAYKVTIGGLVYFVDASSLSLIFSYRDSAGSLTREVHDWGGNLSQPVPPVMLDENGDQLIRPVSADATAARANAQVCYQHFLTTLSRDGVCEVNCQAQKAPAVLVFNVQYGSSGAFWSNTLKQFYFSTGWAAPVEVLCHEYTHAVVQFSDGLIYANESGAVSESIADFFGAIIKNNGSWVIGDSLPGWSQANPLRDMGNPGKSQFNPQIGYDEATNSGQPDNYRSFVTKSDPICRDLELNDNGCVHINSGILSRGLVLAAEGGKDSSGRSYTGMGRPHLEKVVYEAITTSFVSSTGLKSAANDILASCNSLVSASSNGMNETECETLHFAFVTVGLQ